MPIFSRAVIAAAVLIVAGSSAAAAEIKVIASLAAKEALLELSPAFERATGHKVTFTWAGSGAAEKRVLEGEAFDLIMIGPANVDRLVAAGKVAAGSKTPFVKSGVGIALKPGLAKPDVSTSDALKKAALNAKSVAYSQGPSGIYLAELFQKLGIADQIKGRLTQTAPGVQVADDVARGEVDLGFQQVSEMLHHKGIQYLGPLPAEIQHYTVFSFGLHVNSAAQDEAKAFVNFVRSEAAAQIVRKTGLEPG